MRNYFGRYLPELLATNYGKEIWALYEAGALQPDTPLTGRFERIEKAVDLDSVMQEIDDHPGTKVTVLLPRRTYAQLVGRLLHDRTADKMAGAISRVAGATAQIVAYDVGSRIAQATAVARSEKDDAKALRELPTHG